VNLSHKKYRRIIKINLALSCKRASYPLFGSFYAFLQRNFRCPSQKLFGLLIVAQKLRYLALGMNMGHMYYFFFVLCYQKGKISFILISLPSPAFIISPFTLSEYPARTNKFRTVFNIKKISCLASVPIYIERKSFQIPPYENRHNAALTAGFLHGTVSIEGAYNHRRL